MQRFLPMSCRSPLTVPMTTVPSRLDPGRGEDRLDVRHPGLHRPGAGEHLGHEDEVLAELDPDERHAGDQAVVHHLERVGAGVERLASQLVDRLVLALDERGRDRLHLGRGRRRTGRSAARARRGARRTRRSPARRNSFAMSVELGHRSSLSRRAAVRPRASRRTASRDRAQVLDRRLQRDRALGPDHLDAGLEVRDDLRAHLLGPLREQRLGVVDVPDEADPAVDDRHRLGRVVLRVEVERGHARSRRCSPSGRPSCRRCGG